MAKGKKKGSGRKRRGNALVIGGGIALAAVVVAAVFFAFNGGGEGSTRTSARRPTPVVVTDMLTEIEVVDSDFGPPSIQVPVGATIRWKFTGDLPHNVTEDRGRWASDTMTDGEYAQTFDTPGEYYYYCTLHHKMQGTVIVGDGSAGTPAPTPTALATSVP